MYPHDAAVSVFPHEIYKAPRSWAERAYPKLVYFNEVDRGCHFAAWQEPALRAAAHGPGTDALASEDLLGYADLVSPMARLADGRTGRRRSRARSAR